MVVYQPRMLSNKPARDRHHFVAHALEQSLAHLLEVLRQGEIAAGIFSSVVSKGSFLALHSRISVQQDVV